VPNVWIALLDESGKLVTTAEAGLGDDFLPMTEQLRSGELTVCGKKAFAQPGVVVTGDPASECEDCPLAENYAGRGAMTIRLEHSGKIYGMMSVSIHRELAAGEEEQALFEEITTDISFALYGIELEEKHKKAEDEKKALEAQLRQSQKLESIGTLAGGVAHEINNPLMGILSYAELIHDRIQDEKLQEFAKGIIKEGNRVDTIVKNLLSFARQDRQSHSQAHIEDIIDASLNLIGSILRKDQITIEKDIPEDLLQVKCRSQQIEQVIINLLTNARDALNIRYPGYHEDKIIKISVKPFRRKGKKWMRTTIEDHGAGISSEIINRIFDPFFTTKSRTVGPGADTTGPVGTGLGLSVSYGIITDHKGELSVETEPGKYTRFHMDLYMDNGWSIEKTDETNETHDVKKLVD